VVKLTHNLRINGDRLWDSLMEMAKIGALEHGGCRRLTLSDEDKQGRDLFIRWCEEAGCTISIDQMGNIFARRPGKDHTIPPVGIGSHLDTQPHGGKFDGVFGVLAGLEIVRTLNDHTIETTAPIEVVSWTNEEGARFAPSMLASGVFGGVFTLEYALDRRDADGVRFGDELKRIGYAGDLPVGNHPFTAFFEAHIEQGPILEATHTTIGVVTGVQGFRWYDITITGQDAHSGSTPMTARRDALLATAEVIKAVNQIALQYEPDGRGTVGFVRVTPNSRNTIPGQVNCTVDFRHPEHDVLVAMDDRLRSECARIAGKAGVEIVVDHIFYSPPVKFDEACITAVENACQTVGCSYRRMISGAGHDACYVSLVAPTSMVFVPCANGISHSEAESAEPDDLAAGCNVLFHAVLSYAV
jgi:N-carbamoyl-L-amino-acid hydrolase